MKLNQIITIAAFVIGVLLFIVVIQKIGLDQIRETVSMISTKQLLFLILVNLLGIIVSIYRWKIILEALGFPITWARISLAKFIGLAINYITPGVFLGGEPFKALFLKNETDLPLRKSAVSIIIDEALFLGVSFLIIIAGLAFLFHRALLSQELTLTIIGVLLISFGIFYLFFRRIIYKKSNERGFFSYLIHIIGLNKFKFISNVGGKITEIENNLSNFFKEHKKVLYLSILLTIIEHTLYISAFWLTISFLGHSINYQSILSITSIIYINYLIPIPGALGSLELSQSYIFGLLEMNEKIGLGFTLITRVISLFSVIIGFLSMGYLQIKILCFKTKQRINILNNQINNRLK